MEIASNDGYLLQNFHKRGFDCLGVEPTKNTAAAARKKGIRTIEMFFGIEASKKILLEYKKADLIVANNVLAHVPDINDFVSGLTMMLSEDGIITIEFPHLMQLVKNCQFDTIYHEHYSYLSFSVVNRILQSCGLCIFDVVELDTHGGSLRIFAQHLGASRPIKKSVENLILSEVSFGLFDLKTYASFQGKVNKVKNALLKFLVEMNENGKSVHAYGAAAKGNTLLNYMGVRSDLISRVYDASKYKQGKFLPGSHIEIFDPSRLSVDCPTTC